MKRLGFVLAVAGLLSAAVMASIFGTVRGIVHDAQHHPIEGAKVTLRARTVDWQREATTDAQGGFQIDAVPAGPYTIKIQKDSFRDLERELNVAADSAPLLHFPLTLATLSQRVEVQENVTAVDPTSATTSATLTRGELTTTPGATRTNSLDFITDYTPGATLVHDQLHVRGGHQVSWLVDGVPIPNTNIAANVGAQFDPKDMDVVEIQRGGYSAEYGDRTYAVFNVIPRSGFERNREAEIVTTFGSYNSTDSQVSFGDHTNRFAYYTSLSVARTDMGLMTPEPEVLRDATIGGGGFTSLIFNLTPNDQLRFVGSMRTDFFQIPNTLDQEAAGFRDTQRERDAFASFSWIHTAGPGLLVTVAPFFHWNHAAYDGSPRLFGDSGTPADAPPTPVDHRDSYYEGGLVSVAIARGRHNARIGIYGFAQQDDALFGVTANDGSGLAISQTEKPRGGLLALFAEDQFRVANWFSMTGGVRYTHFSGGLTEDKFTPRIGGAMTVPKLKWVLRAYYGRYYQAPPLSTVSGPLLDFAADQGFGFLPLRGEVDEQREFGVAIPLRGWTFDVSNFETHARNFFDHDVLGNSNIFFPLTIDRARIKGTEVMVRSPRIAGRLELHLAYSRQSAEGAGGVTGGLTDFEPPDAGFFFLDHDQHDTLSTGLHLQLPCRAWISGNYAYGSGFLDGDGPNHLPGHHGFDVALGKSFGESFSVGFTAQNVSNSRYLIDNSNTFGGTHWNYPRQLTGEVRWRFHY
ncbi:MAG TPA: TonB-dependent receptor [Methylomirabilota bacterium]|nr:TonB-dependent receptor [Methylomirabilota bacterium]